MNLIHYSVIFKEHHVFPSPIIAHYIIDINYALHTLCNYVITKLTARKKEARQKKRKQWNCEKNSCFVQSDQSLDGLPHKDHLIAFCSALWETLFISHSIKPLQSAFARSLTVTWGWFLDYGSETRCKELSVFYSPLLSWKEKRCTAAPQ